MHSNIFILKELMIKEESLNRVIVKYQQATSLNFTFFFFHSDTLTVYHLFELKLLKVRSRR